MSEEFEERVLEKMRRLELKDGDVLVVKLPDMTHFNQAELGWLHQTIHNAFNRNGRECVVIIVPADTEFSAIHPLPVKQPVGGFITANEVRQQELSL